MSQSVQVSCVSVVGETKSVKVFRFRVLGAIFESAEYKAGRYVSLGFSGVNGSPQERCYSIIRVVPPNQFEVAIQESGRQQVADRLFNTLAVGDLLSSQVPAGDITVERLLSCKQVLMLAGGIGVTLPIGLLRALDSHYQKLGYAPSVRLVWCVPSLSDAPFVVELLALEASSPWLSVDLYLTRSLRSGVCEPFHQGRPSAATFDCLPTPDAVVICGSQSFARSMQERVRKFPQSEVMIEAFSSASVSLKNIGGTEAATRYLQVQGVAELIALRPGKSLLEHLLESDISVPHQCRSGICGSCRIKMIRGTCQLEADFALGEAERAAGYVLACCAFPADESVTVAVNQFGSNN
ncbi:2Fe-2S iron-sulfur cluster-binding protein [Pseudomonas sp. BJa5]|uniref:2Fe-2S iron-sulfur cluster-binding protein n=1 Tax=Pseudomonas sp. BJa5 TaxID=2936270 RepID=UPI002559D4C5|nr:2Fe-2S iron-sulfur cluster-binding protein [Pseudomonas sp. BGr12]MDL2424240.1 2Fe-2S iron-sulfur cluster-binding protein [Pseudomonas sp. BGr12]